jgi:cobalt-zinc-cadmium efflux system protein
MAETATSDDQGGHAHYHTAGANTKMLTLALILTTTFLIAEVVGSFVFNSLALLSDAAHMMTDVAALAIALLAIRIGGRAADDRRTFGYKRFEILAAAFNALLLFAVAIYVLVEAIKRFQKPEVVQSTGMLIVAIFGLIVNLVSMRLLMAGKDKSLNVKGAYLEVWADMLGSVGVIAGALAIRFTGWQWVDPVVAVGIGLWVLPRTWILLRDTANVLLEGVPTGTSLPEVRAALSRVPGVEDVHDLHVWSMSSTDASCTAHLRISGGDEDAIRTAAADVLKQSFGIEHVTIQTERTAHDAAQIFHR